MARDNDHHRQALPATATEMNNRNLTVGAVKFTDATRHPGMGYVAIDIVAHSNKGRKEKP